MFCSECGEKSSGNFCSSCGARLSPPAGGTLRVADPPVDWSQTIDYETLLRIPEVRDRIARCAAQSPKRMSGDQFLEVCNKAIGFLPGVPLAGIAQLAQPLGEKLGAKTGKSRATFVAEPPGTVIVRLLCSLARRGRTLRKAHQLTDGCILEAAMPSDMFSYEGDLIITVARHQTGTLVDAKAVVKGQLFDWGKSSRCLEELFGDLSSSAAA